MNEESKTVLALEQQLRNQEDIGPYPPPTGLAAEDQTAYRNIMAKANRLPKHGVAHRCFEPGPAEQFVAYDG